MRSGQAYSLSPGLNGRTRAKNGLQPQFVAVTPIVNYNGESIAEIKRKTLWDLIAHIFFSPDSDSIELYLERKGRCMMANVKIDGLADAVMKELAEYNQEVTDGIKKGYSYRS